MPLAIHRRRPYLRLAYSRKLTVFGALRLLVPSLASPSTNVAGVRPPHPEGNRYAIGTVKFFDATKGYGFITNEAGGKARSCTFQRSRPPG